MLGDGAPGDFRRHSWMSHRIRGWRLEIYLVVGTWAALNVTRAVIGQWGPDILGLALITALLASQSLRYEVTSRMIRNRSEVALQGVLWTCGVVGRSGALPKVKGVEELPAGRVYLLELPTGVYLESIEQRLPELAVGLNARAVRVRPSRGTARFVELTVIEANAFRYPVKSPLLKSEGVSLWDPITLGVGEDGRLVTIGLAEHNLLIGGEPGSGKSVALSAIVGAGALDPFVSLTLLDGKEVELSAWRDVADRFVGSSHAEAVHVLEDLQCMMNERYHTLALAHRRKIRRDDVDGLEMVVIDELALYLRGGDKATRERFTDLLRDLVARGRAAGIMIIAATQKPSHETVPTYIRDLFSYRLAMRCSSRDASDTILGQGWSAQGYSAASIDPAQRGVGFLLAEGGVPVQLLTANLEDDEIEKLVNRAIEVRSL